MQWKFPSRNFGETEGYGNPGLEWFKDDPLKALAREICQNSLDACYDESAPVRIEFKFDFIPVECFPGMTDLIGILNKCEKYTYNKNDDKAQRFIARAQKLLNGNKIPVLRISDFNTIGLQGAFDPENITPWASLVKSTAVSVKQDTKGSAGSYGIGKAAVFINSDLQTVFYRTKDIEKVEAAQGVARLMAFSDDSVKGEDPIRRSTGYYGNEINNTPVEHIKELDNLYTRTRVGTDIFIPGFKFVTSGKASWVDLIASEILENFLMSIYYGRLEVKIENTEITKQKLTTSVAKHKVYAKNAFCFNRLLNLNEDEVATEILQFHNLGTLKLRLWYSNDLNKKILVVRKTGMKIADISGLPKGISFTGILELREEKLNNFFREMENPQHNKWEPKRHSNPEKAQQYKNEVEEWVRKVISTKLEDLSSGESVINVGALFNAIDKDNDDHLTEEEKRENILDTTKSVEVIISKQKRGVVKGLGGAGKNKTKGSITDDGENFGHRHRTGKKGGKPTGRTGVKNKDGEDSIFAGLVATNVVARIVTLGEGTNRLFITSDDTVSDVLVEIVTIGENGKELPLMVSGITGNFGSVKEGKICLPYLKKDEKQSVDFTIQGKQRYAMEVKVYGN